MKRVDKNGKKLEIGQTVEVIIYDDTKDEDMCYKKVTAFVTRDEELGMTLISNKGVLLIEYLDEPAFLTIIEPVKIMEIQINTKRQNLQTTKSQITKFNSFEEYLNLMVTGRSGLPVYFKVMNREINMKEQEVLGYIYDINEDKFYSHFAKVIG